MARGEEAQSSAAAPGDMLQTSTTPLSTSTMYSWPSLATATPIATPSRVATGATGPEGEA